MKLILQMEIAPDDEEEKVNLPKHPLTYTHIRVYHLLIGSSTILKSRRWDTQ